MSQNQVTEEDDRYFDDVVKMINSGNYGKKTDADLLDEEGADINESLGSLANIDQMGALLEDLKS